MDYVYWISAYSCVPDIISKKRRLLLPMKKIIVVSLSVVIFLFALCGCAKRGICDNCGQKEKLYTYVDPYDGDEFHLCQYCYNRAKEFGAPSSSEPYSIPEEKVVINDPYGY